MSVQIERVSANKTFGGQQLRYKHRSDVLNCDMHFSIYLPPAADSEQVPVLYWLSGLTCTDQNFVTKAGAQKYASELGMAIVCPDTSPRGEAVPDDPEGHWDFGLGAGFYVNATQEPWAKHYQMYDYVVYELPTIVKQHFSVDPERTGISGHSMGGHGALTLGLRNPDKYKSISAFSPIVSPINCPWGQKALSNYIGDSASDWGDYDACALIKTLDIINPVLIDQGLADEFLSDQLLTKYLVDAAEESSCPIQVRYQDGYDHSYFFISSFIENHIRFHIESLS